MTPFVRGINLVFHSTCPQCLWLVLIECLVSWPGENGHITIVCDAWQAGVGVFAYLDVHL